MLFRSPLLVGSVRLERKFHRKSLATQTVLFRPETLLAWWILHPVGNVGECALAHGSRSWGHEGGFGRGVLASCRLCCICSLCHFQWGCRPDGCALHFRHCHHRLVLSSAPSANLCCPMPGHGGSGMIAERQVGSFCWRALRGHGSFRRFANTLSSTISLGEGRSSARMRELVDFQFSTLSRGFLG